MDEHHENLSRPHAKASSDRSFGFVFGVVFAVVALWPMLEDATPRWWALLIGAVFAVLALIRPGSLSPLNRAWAQFGLLLHRVVNPIVMGLLFVLVVAPMGIAMRLLGKDLLSLRLDKEAKSYWIERKPPGPAPESMNNQF